MSFIEFRTAIQKQFAKLAKTNHLFVSHVEKDEIWETYLSAFPEGTNVIYRERGEHDCNCCKSFIRNVGRVMAVIDGEMVSVFDNIELDNEYGVVAKKLAEMNKNSGISGLYLNDTQRVGKSETFETLADGSVKQWDHFEVVLPSYAYSTRGDIGTIKGQFQTDMKSLKRSVETITDDAVSIVLDLIEANNIHRGREFKQIVDGLQNLKRAYKKATDKNAFFAVQTALLSKHINCNIRGTAIGTLLVDLSESMDLEVAVKRFEDKVSGTNYKRTTALITPRMKQLAQEKAQELGVEPSLLRRYSVKSDISVNDVLYSDSSVQPFMADSVFDVLKPTLSSHAIVDSKRVKQVNVDEFVEKILPRAKKLEVLVENQHESNLISLVSPVHESAPTIMRWGNNFSFSYNGDYAESVIKQNVKAAGGIVDAPFRVSLSWNNRDDLDLHLISKNERVYFARKKGSCGCELDVDMRGEKLNQVENIYNTTTRRLFGEYKVVVHNFNRNSNRNGERIHGFEIEMEFNGRVYNLVYPKAVRDQERITVAKLRVNSGEVTVLPSLECETKSRSKEMWGIQTNEFHKVDMVMWSPNHWDNSKKVGNKHLIFALSGCVNPNQTRGFYNEFLIEELQPHRKVFEHLAEHLKTPESNEQLSGLGFSESLRKSVTIRVTGEKTNQVFVVNF